MAAGDQPPARAARISARERSSLLVRTASAIVIAPTAIVSAYAGGALFAATVAFLLVVMCFEWARMVERVEFGGGYYALALCGALALALAGAELYAPAFAAALAAGVLGLLVAQSRARAWIAFGALYLVAPSVALIWLRQEFSEGRALVLLLFAIVWSADSAAYLTGRFLGGPKLSPILSPAKTWSGAIGGGLAGGLAGLVAAGHVFGPGDWRQHLALGLCLGLMSIIGDLAESAFKRFHGIKDISGFIPGHGGFLDRLDGMIFATIAMTFVVYGHILAGN